MRLLRNAGNDRVVDELRAGLTDATRLDAVSDSFSLFAFAELSKELSRLDGTRLVLPASCPPAALLGGEHDRAARNRLEARALAKRCAAWLRKGVELRASRQKIPQGALLLRDDDGGARRAVIGSLSLTTEGLGLAPSDALSLVHASESAQKADRIADWFEGLWDSLPADSAGATGLLAALDELASLRDPLSVYALVLHRLLGERGGALDEDRVIDPATGIRNTVVWKKLFRFQRDAVVGAIDKLERFGGCIIADSVGLGKTFEALAVIKYAELRNDRVLVLCPRRLRDNWTLYRANDRRNVLAADRFNFDVLNHTDLSRDAGLSGDIDLAHVHWGNYDLVVIDESHNFRNKKSPRAGGETRYDRLMRRIIQEGVKTRVLMLSATPVNNRLADLRNQIAFATEGRDDALAGHGVESIETTTRLAQKQFNRWLELTEAERTPARLVEMLGFDYFRLLDLLTIARSRKHVARYYGTEETGRFPSRLPPVNLKADVDIERRFRPVREINREILRLNLAAYTPLKYVLPHRQAAYDAKYSTRVQGGTKVFRQADREQNLIHLLRVNVLKRLESAVSSFALTLERQLEDVDTMLERIEAHRDSVEELDITALDPDDPELEEHFVGSKVRVLLRDVDLHRWRQDLKEDRDRLAILLASAREVGPGRDAKLAGLRRMLEEKVREPLNPGNRKVIVFTAFADTARYLYEQLAPFAKTLGVETALVTGSGGNRTTLPELRRDLGSILTAFSPRSKERPPELSEEGELDLLIATDCISEGQNLQDCDWLVNYDIHWNPVRIIQRFGRIDRIGSTNERIQLVNFWPNMELDEYLDLEQRVAGRMTLLDVSATGEENLIEVPAGDRMNDLEYRKKQLLRLQDSVIDLEDLSSGVSIADLTLTDFRIDLADFEKANPGLLERMPPGAMAVTTADAEIEPGIVFCLKAEREQVAADHPLAPYFLVHVGEDGTVVLPHTQTRRILERFKRLCAGRALPDSVACDRFDERTRGGEEMDHARRLLSAAVAGIAGKSEERAIESLFSPGGTHALPGAVAGVDDFEVVALLVVLPEARA